MENELTTRTPLELATEVLDRCRPGRPCNDPEALGALLAEALEAAARRDWSTYHTRLNQAVCSELGFDDPEEEEALLDYLDALCRGELD